jgi:hypothetical protein
MYVYFIAKPTRVVSRVRGLIYLSVAILSQVVTFENALLAHTRTMAEMRIDPVDGVAYTREELSAYYRGKYRKLQLAKYWEECEQERRIDPDDPDDGLAYTWEEFSKYYKGKYKTKALEKYWEMCTPNKTREPARKPARKPASKREPRVPDDPPVPREPRVPDPPVDDGAGEWVHRQDFTGQKSFGFFVCACRRQWTTAHAYTIYKQGCQGCNKESLPYYMWKNYGAPQRKEKTDRDDQPPHDKGRCEACRLGRCNFENFLDAYR